MNLYGAGSSPAPGAKLDNEGVRLSPPLPKFMKITYREFRNPFVVEVSPDGFHEALFKRFSIGPGWYSLVKDLIVSLFKLDWDGELYQVKEKFGGLRFYIGEQNTEISRLIREAENASYKICEVCGEPGITRPGTWIRTRCDKHNTGRPWNESV